MIYVFPMFVLMKRKMWKHALTAFFTFILIFPTITYRIWLASELWKEETRKLILDGWEFEEEARPYLEEIGLIPSLKYLELQRFVYFSNGKLLTKIQLDAPKGFREWNKFYNLAWESGMYWIGFLSAFFLITGIGDLIFNFILLSKGGKWNKTKLYKKGYKPYTNIDSQRVELKGGLKRKFEYTPKQEKDKEK
jgi:hypothetical protein